MTTILAVNPFQEIRKGQSAGCFCANQYTLNVNRFLILQPSEWSSSKSKKAASSKRQITCLGMSMHECTKTVILFTTILLIFTQLTPPTRNKPNLGRSVSHSSPLVSSASWNAMSQLSEVGPMLIISKLAFPIQLSYTESLYAQYEHL